MTSVLHCTHYRHYLTSVLAERISQNPSYSLRALARALQLQPSQLSKILRGQSHFSNHRAYAVGSLLGLEGRDLSYFCLLVQLESSKSPVEKEVVLERLRELNPQRSTRDLSVDAFRSISDWYHVAILEMTRIDGLNLSAAEIGKRLGIATATAQAALDRLESLELLTRNAEGRLIKTYANGVFRSPERNQALRLFHTQMLEKAIHSLEHQPPEKRIVGSETVAIDPAHLSKANEIIEECFSRINQLSNQTKRPRSVYYLGIQFFSLTPSLPKSGKDHT